MVFWLRLFGGFDFVLGFGGCFLVGLSLVISCENVWGLFEFRWWLFLVVFRCSCCLLRRLLVLMWVLDLC